ncbi:MAG: alpha/beta hydrolase [Desulfobacterales bacterium]|nr:alpha/beta hydrolase [Desulfobacterales bacterium]
MTKHNNEFVVLLHGMARTKRSMCKLERHLVGKGYKTLNPGYPSTSKSIKSIAEEDIPAAVAKCRKQKASKIHFVTHSLGGIVVRQYLQTNSLPKGSRIVMMGPPNHGSEIVDYLRGFFLFKWRNGPAGQELGTGKQSVPNTLKPIKAEVGIITGNKSFNPLFSGLISGPDDGKVSVESAKLEGMKDFIVLPCNHTFIMKNKAAMKQMVYFLENGKFERKDPHTETP